MKNLRHAALGALLIAGAFAVFTDCIASGETSKMRVSLMIENSCSVGTHARERDSLPFALDIHRTSRVTVSCTSGAPLYEVVLDPRPAAELASSVRETSPSAITLTVAF
jgi:hypothetical protein